MSDEIKVLGHSVIQHGPDNDRIYLMKLAKEDYPELIETLDQLAQENEYSKIFAKVPIWAMPVFKKRGYIKEAFIPEFYNGSTGVYFMSKYLKRKRRKLTPEEEAEVQKIIRLTKSKEKSAPKAPEGFTFRILTEDDADQLAELYKVVFKTYPFPIFDPDYIQETMKEHIIYFGAFAANDNLVAASSAETDAQGLNVEMTDFATNPEYRGHSLALLLLYHMEREMKQRGFHVTYTIARAHSPGMNITFAKAGYQYGGTLIHNTHIAGDLETMNVWHKRL